MQRVLFIETSLSINGGQKMSLLISDNLRMMEKIDVVWLIPGPGELDRYLQEKGYKVYYLGNVSLEYGKKHLSDVFSYLRMSKRCIKTIKQIIKNESIDLIYAAGPVSLPWAAIAGSQKKKPVIWHLHHNFEDKITLKLLNFTSGFKSVRKIISVSECVASQIKRRKKVFVLYNPVDFYKFSSGSIVNLNDDIICYKRNSINLMHIGLITPTKRQDISINITNHLNHNGLKTNLWLIGEIDKNNYHYFDMLNKQANQNVHFISKQNNIEDWLKLADLVIIPSIEGFPLVGLESLCAGVPLLTIDKGGAIELCEASGCGEVFKENEYDGLDTKVKHLLGNQEAKEKGIKFASNCNIGNYMNAIIRTFNEKA